jgi:hypothetical protein
MQWFSQQTQPAAARFGRARVAVGSLAENRAAAFTSASNVALANANAVRPKKMTVP